MCEVLKKNIDVPLESKNRVTEALLDNLRRDLEKQKRDEIAQKEREEKEFSNNKDAILEFVDKKYKNIYKDTSSKLIASYIGNITIANIAMVCATTGKSIIMSNSDGMYCEDMCFFEDDLKRSMELFKGSKPKTQFTLGVSDSGTVLSDESLSAGVGTMVDLTKELNTKLAEAYNGLGASLTYEIIRTKLLELVLSQTDLDEAEQAAYAFRKIACNFDTIIKNGKK